MKFICMGFIEESKYEALSEAEGQRMMEECFAYDDELRRGGHFLGGEALQSAKNAVTLRIKNGSVDVTDGPYAETKEILGGILLLEALDLNHAIALMSRHPGVKVGPFEIRPADEETNKLIAERDDALRKEGSKTVSIHHRIGIKAPIAEVYNALSTVTGVARWWTREVTGESRIGGRFEVRFLNTDGVRVGSMCIQVVSLEPDSRVQWFFESGPAEWIGTDVTFALKQEGEHTIVVFSHSGWREAVEFTAHCSMKWATFLLSLKYELENGQGLPSPNDLKIDNWN
jgi:uncharacterized protein YndB with AHSA1/START domain